MIDRPRVEIKRDTDIPFKKHSLQSQVLEETIPILSMKAMYRNVHRYVKSPKMFLCDVPIYFSLKQFMGTL